MVLTRIILLAIALIISKQSAYCDNTKFQQYVQENITPPAQIYQPLSFYHPRYFRHGIFTFNSYDYYQQINDRKYYLDMQDKNTYVSPSEYKIKED